MSQALNRQRAMGSLPEYSPPMLRPATGGPRIDGVICWNRICAVAEDRSRRNHHPGNQRPLPARVAAPVFPPFPPQEDAVVLTIPRVRSRNWLFDEPFNEAIDARMYAEITMNYGAVTEEFVEDTQFGNPGVNPLP
jgi:hypothetical protein